jgi:hypothetical protein
MPDPEVDLPACSNCWRPLPLPAFPLGAFAPCPSCGAQVQVEIFPAFARPVAQGRAGEALVATGESPCFYHEDKKAASVCDACGRFLCGLCDCEMAGRHYCPGCLDTGRQKGSIEQLQSSRPLYARQALVLAILPLFITGLAALYLALRHWKTPGSLVSPQPWAMPTALVLSIIQTIGFTVLIMAAILS